MAFFAPTPTQERLATEIIAALAPTIDQDQLNRLTFLLQVSFRRRRILRTIANELAEEECLFAIFLDERDAVQSMTIDWDKIRDAIIKYGPIILQLIMLFL